MSSAPTSRAEERGLELRSEYRERGFLRQSFALADPSPLGELRADAALFDATLADGRGRAQVPSFFTAAIERVACDGAVRAVVEALLESDGWVVWGPNIAREAPDAAARWHVDLESRHWPSITVVVGLNGCSASATVRCLPGTHRLARTPFSYGGTENTERVLTNARRSLPGCGPPETIVGFGDGRFYVFDARTWHRAASTSSGDRLVLFLQYQRADTPRVPKLLDYERHRWSREPAVFVAAPGVTPVGEVARLPLRERVLGLAGRVLPRRGRTRTQGAAS